MRIAITGATGRVGATVVEELAPTHELTLFTRRHVQSPHRVVVGDLLSETACLRALEGVDAIVHLAAAPDPRRETFELNALGTHRLLEAAREHRVGRVVLASTNCVYGHCFRTSTRPFVPDYLPIDETHPRRPEDIYGLSKIVCEELVASYSRGHGIEAVALRLAWVWGDRERAWWLVEGREDIAAYATGLWAYVDARDAARAFRLAVEADALPDCPVFNINADDTMAEEASNVLTRRFLPHLGDLADKLDDRVSFFSNEHARKSLGWKPRHSWLEERRAA